jgi:hypothetical protein
MFPGAIGLRRPLRRHRGADRSVASPTGSVGVPAEGVAAVVGPAADVERLVDVAHEVDEEAERLDLLLRRSTADRGERPTYRTRVMRPELAPVTRKSIVTVVPLRKALRRRVRLSGARFVAEKKKPGWESSVAVTRSGLFGPGRRSGSTRSSSKDVTRPRALLPLPGTTSGAECSR